MGDKEHLVALIRFGVFEVDARSGEVRKAGVRIKLQDQPFKVLLTLLDHPGEVITREDLRARIWPNESFGDFDHAMNVAVAKLRTALGDAADTPRYVETLHRRGYRFIFPVVPVNGGSAAGSNGKGGTTESDPAAESAAFLASRPSKRSRSVWAAIAIVAATTLGTAVWLRWRERVPAPVPGKEMQISRVTNSGNVASVSISPDGRYLVYVPGASSTGISRKLPDTERQRLKEILREVVPSDAGVIIRTASEGVKEDDIRTDVSRLQERWSQIETKASMC